jgi:hypothetical protein
MDAADEMTISLTKANTIYYARDVNSKPLECTGIMGILSQQQNIFYDYDVLWKLLIT